MKKIILLMMIFILSGCAGMRYGNYTQMSGSKDDFLVSDVTSRIVKIYPAAKNTFRLSQKICDGFGLKLIEKLRRSGYGIVENVQDKQQANFFYVVDESISEKKLTYRVSVYISNQSISRAYTMINGQLQPLTAWTYKE
tara:strand:- start:4810 stop:5226 length:417 start_codon:yes stop_codon:yes gene_type:complete